MERVDIERMVKIEEGLKKNTQETTAIKKEVEQVKQELHALPEKLVDLMIEKFDQRYVLHDAFDEVAEDVKDIKETVDPITAFRKRMWVWIIGLVLTSAGLGALVYNIVREILKRGDFIL